MKTYGSFLCFFTLLLSRSLSADGPLILNDANPAAAVPLESAGLSKAPEASPSPSAEAPDASGHDSGPKVESLGVEPNKSAVSKLEIARTINSMMLNQVCASNDPRGPQAQATAKAIEQEVAIWKKSYPKDIDEALPNHFGANTSHINNVIRNGSATTLLSLFDCSGVEGRKEDEATTEDRKTTHNRSSQESDAVASDGDTDFSSVSSERAGYGNGKCSPEESMQHSKAMIESILDIGSDSGSGKAKNLVSNFSNISAAAKKDVQELCPGVLNSSNPQDTLYFFAAFVDSMAAAESGRCGKTTFKESFTTSSGGAIISTGMTQISEQSARGHGDFCQGATTSKLMDPAFNGRCTMTIMSSQLLGKDGSSASGRGLFQKPSYYWSVLNSGANGGGGFNKVLTRWGDLMASCPELKAMCGDSSLAQKKSPRQVDCPLPSRSGSTR